MSPTGNGSVDHRALPGALAARHGRVLKVEGALLIKGGTITT